MYLGKVSVKISLLIQIQTYININASYENNEKTNKQRAVAAHMDQDVKKT